MERSTTNKLTFIVLALCTMLFTGCATIEGPPNPDDPYESFNRSMYTFNDTLDTYVLKPVAKGYQAITPDPVDKGISNFFSNLDDVLVMFNDLFQFKFGQAASDTARFVVNSTIGLLGFIDVATDFGLPKHNEDFGQTMGYWGIESGPYLVLPFFGPSSVRDGVGLVVDTTMDHELYYDNMSDAHRRGLFAVKVIDKRADLLKATNIIEDTAPDPYSFIRDAWMQRRQNLVYDGSPPDDFNEDDLFEDDLFTDDIKR
jgi:phospholipid-binding lipoprotein MlaA